MNLIVTDQCNRSCPYCFAKKKVSLAANHQRSKNKGRNISLDKVRTYLAFLKKSHNTQFKILGGEPSLHPELTQMVDLALAQGFQVTLFTNGLWPASIQSYFKNNQSTQISFVVNVNEPSSHSAQEYKLQQACLGIAGARARLSFNVYRTDFDLQFAIDLIDRYDLQREIRVGLAGPIAGADNDHIRNPELKKVGKRLVDQFNQLEAHNILGSFDCGFPLCMFDESDLGRLVVSFKEGFASHCGAVIDVDCDLNVWHCFPLSTIGNVHLSDFQDLDALNDHYDRMFAPLRSIGSMNECLTCKFLKRGQCKGGCLGRTITAIESSGDTRLIEKLQHTPA